MNFREEEKMIVDESKLKKQLGDNFSTKVVDKVIEALRDQGLPVVVTPRSFDLEMGEDVSIKFFGPDLKPPTSGDLIRSWLWEAKIGEIDPRRVKAVKIPELTHDGRDVLTIDAVIYPFIFTPLLFKDKNQDLMRR